MGVVTDKLFLMSKIQDLKGTHNSGAGVSGCQKVVSDVKDTRFERNSQRKQLGGYYFKSCF